MSNIKKMHTLMDNFTEEEAPVIYYAWQAVRIDPANTSYREHLLQLLDRFNFAEEYETVLREGIKACPNWKNGPALLAKWLSERGEYREASYNARIAADNQNAAIDREGLFDTLLRLKNSDGNYRKLAKAHVRAAKRPLRKA